MKVQFKSVEHMYDCTEPIEQKIFKSGVFAGWVIIFHINANINSTGIDDIITPESISELRFVSDDDAVNTITGYSAVSACTIRHKNTGTVAELQFTKMVESKTDNATEDGV